MADSVAETMRDRGAFWSPAPDWASARVDRPGWSARRLSAHGRTLVSGDLAAAKASLAPDAAEVGLWGISPSQPAFLRMARDKALLVTPQPLAVASGWNAAGFVATPCDDGYAAFEISGEGLRDVICEATAADLDAGSPSAAIVFAGVAGILYRRAESVAVLEVESPLSAYIWSWLERA